MNVVEMRGIYKYFSDTCANKNVDFSLRKGEIHALLGENGAGKSTLMNILYGLYTYDAGTITVNGARVDMENPATAIRHGIGMVHQHFMLIPQLTVTQNIFLCAKEAGFVLNMPTLEARVEEMNRRFGFRVDPSAFVWQLPVGIQQKVEILKALARNIRILILDEPSAVLTPKESDELFSTLQSLVREGYSVILITHKMQEVLDFSDRVTVMRAGEVVDTLNVSDTDAHALANMMVGREVFLQRQTKPQPTGEPMLEVCDLTVKNDKKLDWVKNISFQVRAGEIVGIAGVDGNGQLELGEAIAGGRTLESGSIRLCGKDITRSSIRRRLDMGLAHIPDDRQKKGLVLQFPIKDNILLSGQRSKQYANGFFLNTKKIEARTRTLVERFDVRPTDINLPAGSLSGGNQQKVILAREVDRGGKVLLAFQPTRGLDIGAIEFVRAKLVEERAKGAAILLISTDLDEIRSLSDRILVMYEGHITGELPYNAPLEQIGLMIAGHDTTTIEKARGDVQ